MAVTNDDLIRFVDQYKPRRILVAGDFMLDRYVYGNAQRLSPDAPVPVLAIEREEWLPGGSANVCLDLVALSCKVDCLGAVGKDDNGKRLAQSLKDRGCGVSGLVKLTDRPTTIKQNFVGLAQHRHPQKMFRADIEDKTPLSEEAQQRVIASAEKLMPKADVLCLEDYNKGVLTPHVCKQLIALAKKHNVPVLVDPAAIEDYSKYKGAHCITPNRTEAGLATGMDFDDPNAMAKKLLKDLNLNTIVITLDRQGALLLEKGKKPTIIPTIAQSVYDVTGAGDMVLAMLAGARANGADWQTAVNLANIAGGLEVQRFGVVPIELDEIIVTLLERRHEELGKVRRLDQLLPEIQAYRKQGKRIAFTNGCFDILHAGHVAYLRSARKQGDLLIVAVNADSSIKKLKGPDRPVNKEADRLLVLSELESVDYVIVFPEDTPMKLLRAIKPDVLVKGGDYGKEQVVGWEFVEGYGGNIAVVDLVKGRSTTNIIRKLESTQ